MIRSVWRIVRRLWYRGMVTDQAASNSMCFCALFSAKTGAERECVVFVINVCGGETVAVKCVIIPFDGSF